MNYWPAEPTNLSDMPSAFPQLYHQHAQSEGWQRAAREFNKINGKPNKGWTVFTESNIFGGMSTWSATTAWQMLGWSITSGSTIATRSTKISSAVLGPLSGVAQSFGSTV